MDSRFLITNSLFDYLTHLRSTSDRSKLLPATVSLLLPFFLSLSLSRERWGIVETITELSDEQGVQYAILSGATVFIIAFEAISLGMEKSIQRIAWSHRFFAYYSQRRSIFSTLNTSLHSCIAIEKLEIANPNVAPWPRLRHQTSDICRKKGRVNVCFVN